MGFIYKIINNVNGKVYIGQTRRTIAERYREHIKCIKEPQYDLHKSFVKYGINNFIVEQLEECDNNLLNDREIYWIAHYKSYNKRYGYNQTKGGDNAPQNCYGKSKKSKECDVYLLNGEYITTCLSYDDASKKFDVNVGSISLCCRGKNHRVGKYIFTNKGMQPNIDIVVKNTNGKKRHNKIYQYDLDGNFMEEYEYLEKAQIVYGNAIRHCFDGTQKTAYGYQWSYEKVDKIDPYKKPNYSWAKKYSKRVLAYTKQGRFIDEYNSLTDCSNILGITIDGISKVCRNECQSFKGYVFKYAN